MKTPSKKLFKITIVLSAGLLGWSPNGVFSQTAFPDGFAAMKAIGLNGTTGGAGGTIVTVFTTEEFLEAIRKEGLCTIRVDGTMTLDDMEDIRSGKTIVGVGSRGAISGGGLNLSNVSNIIIRNLRFTGSLDDGINVEDQTHHVWIDHCDLDSAFDGLLDIKRGSDFITVSWNTFTKDLKTSLVGHDDVNAAQDSGHLRVTYHHNYFNRTDARNPRVRFSALCHVFNNYYLGNSHGAVSTMDAEVLVEGNFFRNVKDPTMVGYAASGPGDLVERDNIFENCDNAPQVRGEVPEPPYSCVLDSASAIPQMTVLYSGRAGFIEESVSQAAWVVYDAGSLPEENVPAFAASDAVNPPDTTGWIMDDPDVPGNRWLRFSSLKPDKSTWLWNFPWGMEADSGATIAFRVKPINPDMYDRSFHVVFRDGFHAEGFALLQGGVQDWKNRMCPALSSRIPMDGIRSGSHTKTVGPMCTWMRIRRLCSRE